MSEEQRLFESSQKGYDGDCIEAGGPRRDVVRDEKASGVWYTFAASMMLMSCAGTLWSFGAFSRVFKDGTSPYIFNQTSLQFLSIMSTAGNYILYDGGFLVARYGSVVGMIYGAICVTLGYFSLWICVAVMKTQVPFVVLCACFLLYGHGCGLLDNASISEMVMDFPNQAGSAVGCCKSFYGLSASLLTVIGALLVDSDPKSFLLMLGIYCGAVCVFSIPIVRLTKGFVPDKGGVSRKFYWVAFGIFVAALTIGGYVIVMARLKMPLFAPNSLESAMLMVIAVAGFASLWLVVLPDTHTSASEAPTPRHFRPQSKECTVAEMVLMPEFWMLFTIFCVTIGTGIMVINNAGQILPSYIGVSGLDVVPDFVAVLSVFNCLGRLVAGNASEMMKGSISRPWFLVGAISIMTSGFAGISLIGNKVPHLIWLAAPLIVFGWGCVWGLLPVLIYDIFGAKDFSLKYALGSLSGIFGGLLFSTLLAGKVFDAEANSMNTYPACYVPSCYSFSFNVAVGCNVFVLLLSLLLFWTVKEVYGHSIKDT
jgi:hypothetical protein